MTKFFLYLLFGIPIATSNPFKACQQLLKNTTLNFQNPTSHQGISTFSPQLINGKFRINEVPAYDPNAAYLGVANSSGAGEHHYYLIVGDQRIDGKNFGWSSVTKKEKGKFPHANEGVIYKLTLKTKSFERLYQQIQQRKNKFSPHCLHTICDVFERADILNKEQLAGRPTSAAHFDHLFVNTTLKRNPLGPSLTQIDLFATSETKLQDFFENSATIDSKGRKQVLKSAAFYLLLAGIGVGSVLNAEKEEK